MEIERQESPGIVVGPTMGSGFACKFPGLENEMYIIPALDNPNKGILVGNNGHAPIELHWGNFTFPDSNNQPVHELALTVIEKVPNKTAHLLTIFPDLSAVYSRHTYLFGVVMPSQTSGTCRDHN